MKATDEQLIKDHFASHSAEYRPIDQDFEELVWSNGKSNISKVIYLRRKNVLFVTGDLGSAVYRWSESFSLKRIASCNLGYFASKCEASEEGKDFEMWSEEECLKSVRDHLEESEKTWAEFVKLGGESAAESYFDWCEWLRVFGDEIFGSDSCELCRIGFVIAIRCRLHLLGLRQAMKSLVEVKA